jgi:hypothetical protein
MLKLKLKRVKPCTSSEIERATIAAPPLGSKYNDFRGASRR